MLQKYRDDVLNIFFREKPGLRSRKGIRYFNQSDKELWSRQHIEQCGKNTYFMSDQLIHRIQKYVSEFGYTGELPKEQYITQEEFFSGESILTPGEQDTVWEKLIRHPKV
jgi:hypothetical protein